MRILKRIKTTITYKLYAGKTEKMDGSYKTGEYTVTYGSPQTAEVYVSVPRVEATYTPYGVEYLQKRTIVSESDLGLTTESIVTYKQKDYVVCAVKDSFNHHEYIIQCKS